MYLDRALEPNPGEIFNVYPLHLYLWKRSFFDELKENIETFNTFQLNSPPTSFVLSEAPKVPKDQLRFLKIPLNGKAFDPSHEPREGGCKDEGEV
jgi:hypothetical protein